MAILLDILHTNQRPHYCRGYVYLQVKKGELTGVTAMLVHESTGQIAAKYRAKIVVGNLEWSPQCLIESGGMGLHVR